MNPDELRSVLEAVRSGRIDVDDALRRVAPPPVADLGYAVVDLERRDRCGFPEVVLAEGKTAEWCEGVIRQLAAAGQDCLATRVNAVHEPWNRNPRRLAHADTLARTVRLDMTAAGWSPTVDNYLGRVPKARILEAVRGAKGEASAQLIDHLKKPDMAKEAERLLAGTRWLAEPLRTPCVQRIETEAEGDGDAEGLPAFLADGDEDGAGDPTDSDPEEPQPRTCTAE